MLKNSLYVVLFFHMEHSFGSCPQCAQLMRIESLRCWKCDTSVNGRMSVPLLARLSQEQSEFAEKFLLANGNLTQVQKLMECSYPKVRRLLNETMGRLKKEIEADLQEKEEILGSLEQGRLEGKEAVKLIRGFLGGQQHDKTS